jgi:hypothetical protein
VEVVEETGTVRDRDLDKQYIWFFKAQSLTDGSRKADVKEGVDGSRKADIKEMSVSHEANLKHGGDGNRKVNIKQEHVGVGVKALTH